MITAWLALCFYVIVGGAFGLAAIAGWRLLLVMINQVATAVRKRD